MIPFTNHDSSEHEKIDERNRYMAIHLEVSNPWGYPQSSNQPSSEPGDHP